MQKNSTIQGKCMTEGGVRLLSHRWLLGGGLAAIAAGMILLSSCSEAGVPAAPGESPVRALSAEAAESTEAAAETSAWIQMMDKQHGWAFGERVEWTENGGVTWLDRTPEGYDGARAAFYPLHDRVAWLVVRPAYREDETARNVSTDWSIARTTDGGDSWTSAPLPVKGTWSVPNVMTAFDLYFLDEKTGFFTFISDPAGGPVESAFYRTADGGQTWAYSGPVAPKGSLVSTPSGMSFRDPLHGYITFYNPRTPHQPEVYSTEDGGMTWKPMLFQVPGEIREAAFFAEHAPVFFGAEKREGALPVSFTTSNNERSGAVWYTTEDGGITWKPGKPIYGSPSLNPQNGGAPSGFRAQAAADLRHFWMIDAESGVLYGSTDGGAQWTKLSASPQLQNVGQLFFIDEQTGWAQGRGIVLQTADGGRTWNEVER